MVDNLILIADDSELNRSILREMFENDYLTVEASNGKAAIEIIERHGRNISAVLLDLVMPNVSGLGVLEFMKRTDIIKSVPVILITGDSSPSNEEAAYSLGASDVVHKPFSRNIVLRRTKNIIELYKEKNHMERELEKRSLALMESHRKLQKQNEFLVNALSSVVEFRNLESGAHIRRVKFFTRILLNHLLMSHPEYGLTEEDAEIITSASALHDLGKIGIPDNILLKPARLTPEEFEVIKKHTLYGCELLERFKQEDSKFYRACYEICRHHHERYDGKGYPDGLTGEDIPISAQVISVVDVFDALVSKRVYKGAYENGTAFQMIMEGECGNFSPALLDCFAKAKYELYEAADFLKDTDTRSA